MKKILFFLLSFTIFTAVAHSQIFKKKPKKPVPGKEVTLTRHPDKVTLKGTDKKDYFLLFSLEEKCLLITDNKNLYDSISIFLPLRSVPGRSVEVDGPSIDPFTIFTKKQLQEQSERVGFAINKFNTFRIFNSELIEIKDKGTKIEEFQPAKKEEVKQKEEEPVKAKRKWGN
ncbi:hypothetical protein IT402_03190 [Candidatus Nomurabacteria bacterium]|nr:hypothetical protein [Candidatus Nomurabacteria bacterium]